MTEWSPAADEPHTARAASSGRGAVGAAAEFHDDPSDQGLRNGYGGGLPAAARRFRPTHGRSGHRPRSQPAALDPRDVPRLACEGGAPLLQVRAALALHSPVDQQRMPSFRLSCQRTWSLFGPVTSILVGVPSGAHELRKVKACSVDPWSPRCSSLETPSDQVGITSSATHHNA